MNRKHDGFLFMLLFIHDERHYALVMIRHCPDITDGRVRERHSHDDHGSHRKGPGVGGPVTVTAGGFNDTGDIPELLK